MPSVIEVFSPWSRQPSPSGTASSSMLAASVPWPGSASSAARPATTALAAWPPYSSGIRRPVSPIPAMSSANSRRNAAALSSDW